mmetsp:Transcript_5380/g.16059  ORF Transcript_5380/g.16059 Transcript_5380/m.16059 type:complete len:244 (+) Transcript_5380:2875-3606(+)
MVIGKAIELIDALLCIRDVVERHVGKALRLSGHPITRQIDTLDSSKAAEKVLQIGLGRICGDVGDTDRSRIVPLVLTRSSFDSTRRSETVHQRWRDPPVGGCSCSTNSGRFDSVHSRSSLRHTLRPVPWSVALVGQAIGIHLRPVLDALLHSHKLELLRRRFPGRLHRILGLTIILVLLLDPLHVDLLGRHVRNSSLKARTKAFTVSKSLPLPSHSDPLRHLVNHLFELNVCGCLLQIPVRTR